MDKVKMKRFEPLFLFIGIALFIMAIGSVIFHYERKLQQRANQVSALRSQAIIYRNKFNESVIERQSLVGSTGDLKKEIDFWKQQGDTLRTKVNSKTKQIVLLKQQLHLTATGKPTIIYDTIPGDSIPMLNDPTYVIDTVNRWFQASVKVNSRRYDLNVLIKDLDTEVVSEWKPSRLFKRGYYNIKAVSRNPYVENTDLKSITIKQKRTRLIGKAALIAVGLLSGLVIQ